MSYRKAQNHLKKACPKMKALIEEVGPCQLEVNEKLSPYQYSVRAIIYQQLATKAANAIHKKFLTVLGKKNIPSPDVILSYTDEQLREAGLSYRKIEYIKEIAKAKKEGLIPGRAKLLKMEPDQARELLTQIKGVGKWTVDMVLIFNVGHLDIMAEGDYGVRKGYSLRYKKDLIQPKELIKKTEMFSPYRSIACWYFWRQLEL